MNSIFKDAVKRAIKQNISSPTKFELISVRGFRINKDSHDFRAIIMHKPDSDGCNTTVYDIRLMDDGSSMDAHYMAKARVNNGVIEHIVIENRKEDREFFLEIVQDAFQ